MNGKRRIVLFIWMALLLIAVAQSIRAADMNLPAELARSVSGPAAEQPFATLHSAPGRRDTAIIRQNRAAWEQRLLASAVRLELRVFGLGEDGELLESLQSSTGHGTVKDGRFLVTHNHYGVSVTDVKPGTITVVTVFKANEEEIVLRESLSAIRVAFEDPETLVLDFGVCRGEGVFAQLGVASADFRNWEAVALQPGMEVAQLDWDGETAHVDWVEIEEVINKNGVCSLRLANFVRTGASGGPVFLDGYHIGNNWTRVTLRDPNTEQVIDQHSFAALNSSQVAEYIAY